MYQQCNQILYEHEKTQPFLTIKNEIGHTYTFNDYNLRWNGYKIDKQIIIIFIIIIGIL